MSTERNEQTRERPQARTEPEELIEGMVRAFVWNPDDVMVQRVDSGSNKSATILQLTVNQADYGAVVGKMGRKITALQTIAQFLGHREGKKIRVILPEVERSGRPSLPEPFMPNFDWKPDKVVDLMNRILKCALTKPFRVEVIDAPEQANLEIHADPADGRFIEALQPYLHTVFHAIGKADGKQLYIKTATPILGR